MRIFERLGRAILVLSVFALASYFALEFDTGGLWRGLQAAHAGASPGSTKPQYDLTQLNAVNETLGTVKDKYVDPDRVKPRQMFLSALNQIQREVAQVIVLHEDKSPSIRIKVDTEEAEFRVDNIQGPWDVSARLREVFAFLQSNLRDTEVELQEIEYAACNGMLRTLDPHSVFLSPEQFEEMTLSTTGQFGGLGIVISIRDQVLTIMRPIPGTPAAEAGLERLDRITKINNESTLNMPLEDAVNRLRGDPGSKVTVWVHRDGENGWSGSRPFELEREQIKVDSVESRMLEDNVGYIRIKQFQSTTSQELASALQKLRGERFSSLVLDLRSNPGGLLDQATRVADTWLSEGTLVATKGAAEGRDEKKASRAGTEPNYPIVVLVNLQSASASEIVAGALKNLNRAVIVGQTTWGKGSVQLVFRDITPDGAALKLTIAQYLTPGDISIQGTGVTPDIELDPMTADTLEMDLFRSDPPMRERDLSRSLSREGTTQQSSEPPFSKLRYNLPESERAEMRELGAVVADEFRKDFPIRFASKLAGSLKPAPRPQQLQSAQPLLAQVQKTELDSVAADLAEMGIDWSEAPESYEGPQVSDYTVVVDSDRDGDKAMAGEPMSLKVTVENKGKKPVYQLRAVTKSDSDYYNEKELVFGRIDPGESKTATAPLGWCTIEGRKPGSTKPLSDDAKRLCTIPKDAVTRQDVVRVRFHTDGGEPPNEAELRPTVESLPRPIFAYSYQIADDRQGNGDGQLSRGEAATIYLTVKNVGKGQSYETQANIGNLTGDGLLLRAGRFDISNMKPDEVKRVAFTFDVLPSLRPEKNQLKIELSIADRDLRVGASEKLIIPVVQDGLKLKPTDGTARIQQTAAVRGEPLNEAREFGVVEAGSVVQKLATFGEYTKIGLDGERFGFVRSSALAPAKGKLNVDFHAELTRSPPLLEVDPAKLATRDDSVHIEGKATDPDGVLDAYIFVGGRKIFYQSNRKGSDPKTLSFSFDAALQPGINVINVVARESEDTSTRHTMVVRRDGPKGQALPTPDSGLFGEDWEFVGDWE